MRGPIWPFNKHKNLHFGKRVNHNVTKYGDELKFLTNKKKITFAAFNTCVNDLKQIGGREFVLLYRMVTEKIELFPN